MKGSRRWWERLLATYLQRHGWVVFWLDEPSRFCSAEVNWSVGRGVCWLRAYRQSQGCPDFPADIAPIYQRRYDEICALPRAEGR